jgi:hypothetical protein
MVEYFHHMKNQWMKLSKYAPWFVDFWYHIVVIILFIVLAVIFL